MPIKAILQTLLGHLGIHQRLKASALYDIYWQLIDRQVIDKRRCEVAFYRELLIGLKPGDVIFDVGANHGQKTDIFLRLGAQVVAIEPDETNQAALRQKFHNFRILKRPVAIVEKAVSDTCSPTTMWINAPGSAKNTLSHKWAESLTIDASRFGTRLEFATQKQVETITLEELFAKHGTPLFVKIDVEGYEFHVLRGLRHPVPYLSFEVNLPDFLPERLECVQLLGRLAANGKFNYAVDCGRGLALGQWLEVQTFSNALRSCSEPSIEVVWKTGISVAGYSLGGVVAFELCRQLTALGTPPLHLFLLDVLAPGYPKKYPLRERIRLHATTFLALGREEKRAYLTDRWTGLRQRWNLLFRQIQSLPTPEMKDPDPERRDRWQRLWRVSTLALHEYKPAGALLVPTTLFTSLKLLKKISARPNVIFKPAWQRIGALKRKIFGYLAAKCSADVRVFASRGADALRTPSGSRDGGMPCSGGSSSNASLAGSLPRKCHDETINTSVRGRMENSA